MRRGKGAARVKVVLSSSICVHSATRVAGMIAIIAIIFSVADCAECGFHLREIENDEEETRSQQFWCRRIC